MRLAVIDLGTNTCNLLVVEVAKAQYKILWQGKEPVRLVDKVGYQNFISKDGINRAVTALTNHRKIIEKFEVHDIRTIATSAVRTAENQKKFIEEILERTGFQIDVIADHREAELIYKGVLLAFNQLNENTLILDIGGGSNELIISGNEKTKWMDSFPAGVSRVINQFEISDPITEAEIEQLRIFFEVAHKPAIEMYQKNRGSTLVGCSGAFDTIADMIDQVNPNEKARTKQKIEVADFRRIYQLLIQSTKAYRETMKGMDPVRLELIVPAVILINTIIEKTGITEIYQTDFALREGILWEYLNGE